MTSTPHTSSTRPLWTAVVVLTAALIAETAGLLAYAAGGDIFAGGGAFGGAVVMLVGLAYFAGVTGSRG